MSRGDLPMRERLPDRVSIVEVGPRDGLQAERVTVPTGAKVDFIERLLAAGHTVIEATSFVSAAAVPQLADAAELLARIPWKPEVRYPVLVPNERGLERALAAGVREIAVFVSASESYSRRNLQRSRADALVMCTPVVSRAKAAGLRVRGYLSMVFADPWDGPTPVGTVVATGRSLLELGCDELSLGDTIGIGTAAHVQRLITAYAAAGVPPSALAVHFHDTYGQGLANVLAALELGVTTIDASAGGLGGSAFAPGAAGNLATEDLVWMLDGLGIETGVNVRKAAAAGAWMCQQLGREPAGRVTRALSRVL
ncbi:MAG: hydroxymethylglutaryl-CoA lyase [Candidatus Limnocylindria bacterium]